MPAARDTHSSTTPTTATAGAATGGIVSRLAHNRIVLGATAAVVLTAVAGTTVGYASMKNTVTLSVDGEVQEVSVMGDTVGDVLAAEGIDLEERDLVQPDVEESIHDGSHVSVIYSKPVELTVDGKTSTHYVTATDVEGALDQIGSVYADSRLSTSRSADLDRGGNTIEVVTQKKLTVALAGKKPVTRKVAALTVADALRTLEVDVDKHDIVKPGLKTQIGDGDKLTYTDIEVSKKRVKGESFSAAIIEREDDSEVEGTETVIREGEPGTRNATYRIVKRNGEVVKRVLITQNVLREPVAEIVEVGTAEPAPTTNYAGGNTVWDRLAQCESGGNWAINTGNGYYGGLQFSLSTWQAYGGTGLPSSASRETQIAIAEKLRAATGGYGSWPGCAAALGLPM